MKKIFALVLLVFLLLTTSALAATPEISSDSRSFDPLTMSYSLKGNVRVKIGDIIITADNAQVQLLTLQAQGQGNIHLKQGDEIDFHGESVSVDGPASQAAITGPLDFKQEDLLVKSDFATFNWKTKLAVFTGNVLATKAGTTSSPDKLVYNVISKQIISAE